MAVAEVVLGLKLEEQGFLVILENGFFLYHFLLINTMFKIAFVLCLFVFLFIMSS